MNNELQEDIFQEDKFQEKEFQEKEPQKNNPLHRETGEKESGEIAAQLRGIRKVLSFAAGCLAVLAVTQGVSNVYYMVDDMRENKEAVMGRTYYDQSDFLATERRWDELLALAKSRQRTNPTDPNGFWFEGIAHYNQERWDDAMAAFKKAADVNPSWDKISRKWIEAARKRKTNSQAEQLSS